MNKDSAGAVGSALAGAVTIILDYILQLYTGVDLPTEVTNAITVVFATVGAYVLSRMTPHVPEPPHA